MKDDNSSSPVATEGNDKPRALSRYTFLNPDYLPNHVDEKRFIKHRTSGLAGDVWALIKTIESAFDAASDVPHQLHGVSTTLGVAANMAGDLLESCEFLERDLEDARKSTA